MSKIVSIYEVLFGKYKVIEYKHLFAVFLSKPCETVLVRNCFVTSEPHSVY